MLLGASGLLRSLTSMRIFLSRLYKDFDIFTGVINAVSGVSISLSRQIRHGRTYVSVPCVWQSVYCAWNSSVAVGPDIWYSSVPAMHQLLYVSTGSLLESTRSLVLLSGSMGMTVGHSSDSRCRRTGLCNGRCRSDCHSLSTGGTSRPSGSCCRRSCGRSRSRVGVRVWIEILRILRSSTCCKSHYSYETGNRGHSGGRVSR